MNRGQIVGIFLPNDFNRRRKMKYKKIKILVGVSIVLLLVTIAVMAADYSVEIADRYGFKEITLPDGAIVSYIGDYSATYGSSGSGIFESFVRLQGNPKKTDFESGYNTDGTREFDTKGGAFTHSILLSEIPTIEVDGNLYLEFFADINEKDSGELTHISLDDFELYLTDDPNLTGYDFGLTPIYDFDDGNEGEHILINDVNQGSGRGDLRYLVPNGFGPEECNYGNPACTTYLVLYSEWGGLGGDYGFDGGFEEWKVKKYPILQVSKDINGSYDTEINWAITKDFDGAYAMWAGDSVLHGYEVSVVPTVLGPLNTKVYGTITILGDDDDDVNATITDHFNGYEVTNIICAAPAGDLPGTYLIAAKATVTCTYEFPLGAPVGGTNVARATYDVDGTILAFEGSADILEGEFVETLTGEPHKNISVTDNNGEEWTANYDTGEIWPYSRTFTCSSDAGDYTDGHYGYTHDNVAMIIETGDWDTATVTVDCYLPEASIKVTPDGVNEVGDEHTFTIEVIPATIEGLTSQVDFINFDLSDPSKLVSDTCATPISNACDVVINSLVATIVTINADTEVTFTITPVPFTTTPGGSTMFVVRDTDGISGPLGNDGATKTYVDARISISANDIRRCPYQHQC
jgi:hypothetical protein